MCGNWYAEHPRIIILLFIDIVIISNSGKGTSNLVPLK